jgi:hypothetical protein
MISTVDRPHDRVSELDCVVDATSYVRSQTVSLPAMPSLQRAAVGGMPRTQVQSSYSFENQLDDPIVRVQQES